MLNENPTHIYEWDFFCDCGTIGEMLRRLFTCFSLSFVFLLLACVSRPQGETASYPVASYVPEVFEWKEVCPGVSRFDFENNDLPLIYHAVKIDLDSSEGAAFKLVASRGESVSDFASREACLVAINATPFDKDGRLVGIHKEAGELLSGPVERYAAIGFSEDKALIVSSQNSEELKDCTFVFGGFYTVLENGIVRQDFIQRQDSRSGAGLSEDGRTLYLLVVEGEWTLQSAGLSYPQCGEIFKAMGCSSALEFDGGGSSELCINGKSILSYKVYRKQGNAFGFKN